MIYTCYAGQQINPLPADGSIPASLLKSGSSPGLHLDSTVTWFFNPLTGNQELFQNSRVIYDQDGRPEEIRYFVRDPVTGNPGFSSTAYISYDSNGNLTQKLVRSLNSESGEWEPAALFQLTYNSEGRPTQEIYSVWPGNAEEWKLESRLNLVYGSGGRLDQFTSSIRDNDNQIWVQDMRVYFGYNSAGELVLETRNRYNPDTQQWTSDHKREYSYDHAAGRVSQVVSLTGSGEEAVDNFRRQEDQYDNKGNLTLTEWYDGVADEGEWSFSMGIKFENEYSSHNKIEKQTQYQRSSDEPDWLYDQETIFFYSKEIFLRSLGQDVKTGRSFEIPFTLSGTDASDNILSYQFDFNYGDQSLEYTGFSVNGTLSEHGNLLVNPESGKLSVSWNSVNPLSGDGELIRLRFRALDAINVSPSITNALFGSLVASAVSGTISSEYFYGDIDANEAVQSFDAALVLQYSVSLDPIPEIDPLPWEQWRIVTANVDGVGGITSNDAAEILKYASGLIDLFPAESAGKAAKSTAADVTVTFESDEILFRSTGQLYGLDVSVTENFQILGEPEILNTYMLKATHVTSEKYAVGLATAISPSDNEIFMRIPVTPAGVASLSFEMMINTVPKGVMVSFLPSSLDKPDESGVTVFPNPASRELNVTGLEINSFVSVYDMGGREVLSFLATAPEMVVDISSLQSGVYIIATGHAAGRSFTRFLKL